MTLGRWISVVVVALAIIIAWNGGFYSSRDYAQLKRNEAEARQRLIRLRIENDSLGAFLDSLEHSQVVQERVAREQLGMIRPGELVILVVPVAPDSAKPKPD